MAANNIITPRRREDFFDRDGEPTLRFIKWVELVTGQTNASSGEIEDLEPAIELSPHAQWMQRQIDGLPEYTIDTTGFTIDTTLITTDKVTA